MSARRGPLLRFEDHAHGRPFHAALVALGARAGETDPHGHADFCEFMGILDGHGQQRLPAVTQELSAGDVVMLRPGDEHAPHGRGPAGMRFVNVAFPASSWRSFVDLTGLDQAYAWDRAAGPPTAHLAGTAASRMGAIFTAALDAYHRDPTMLDLTRFWTDLIDLLAGERLHEPLATYGPQRPDWLGRTCAAMRRPENLRAGVPRMLELAHVSPAHLARTVRAHYGMTPTELVAGVRLEHAARLLATTSRSVTGITADCGFSSQSYFSRCFRRAHGVAPRDFRRQAQRAFVP